MAQNRHIQEEQWVSIPGDDGIKMWTTDRSNAVPPTGSLVSILGGDAYKVKMYHRDDRGKGKYQEIAFPKTMSLSINTRSERLVELEGTSY